MEENKSIEDDLSSMMSDDESINGSPNAKNLPKIQFSKHPKNVRDFAAKIRKIERKIMLGLLTDVEETKLRSSKYFSKRFERLLNLSNNNNKCNLYKLVTDIKLNRPMIEELQKKKTSPNIRKKIQTKIHNLGVREKTVQEKVKSGTLCQNDVDSFLRDMYFNVNFDDVVLDHPPNSQVSYFENKMSNNFQLLIYIPFPMFIIPNDKTAIIKFTIFRPLNNTYAIAYPHVST